MGVTRRFAGEFGLVAVLAGLAVLFARPVLLVGAGGVGGWLLARQFAFVRAARTVDADLTVEQSPDSGVVTVNDAVEINLTARLPRPSPVSLAVEIRPPAGVETTDGSRRATVPAGERAGTATVACRFPVAGTFRFDRPTVGATDPTGRFRASFPAGSEREVTVDAPRPRNVHVGAGGEAVSVATGEAGGDRRGPGLDLAEIRAYVPGDTMRQIDWNATARFDRPHVREFETGVERRTTLVLDCRARMADGPAGETKFEYLRQVALAVTGYARERTETASCYAVGDEGVLAEFDAVDDPEGYDALERRLRTLEPSAGPDATRRGTATADGGGSATTSTDVDGATTGVRAASSAVGAASPAVARRRVRSLRGDDSAFAERLRPFFADVDPYVERVEADPLFRVVRTRLDRPRGPATAVVLTDDAGRAETREAVEHARRHSDHVLAFLTPSVLFDRDATTDPENAYERYADFERFRRELDRLDGVSAFEVGPGDRLARLLAAVDERGRRARAGE